MTVEPDIIGKNLQRELLQDWYFTFGASHEFPKCYTKFFGTKEGTRQKMFSYFGNKWCMQYEKEKGEELVKEYNMKELKCGPIILDDYFPINLRSTSSKEEKGKINDSEKENARF